MKSEASRQRRGMMVLTMNNELVTGIFYLSYCFEKWILIHIVINKSYSRRIKCQLPFSMNDTISIFTEDTCGLVASGTVVLGVGLAVLFVCLLCATLNSLPFKLQRLSCLFFPVSPTFSIFSFFWKGNVKHFSVVP